MADGRFPLGRVLQGTLTPYFCQNLQENPMKLKKSRGEGRRCGVLSYPTVMLISWPLSKDLALSLVLPHDLTRKRCRLVSVRNVDHVWTKNLFRDEKRTENDYHWPDIYVSLQLRVQNWTTKWHFPLNFQTAAYPELLLKGLSFSCYRMDLSELPNHASTLYYHV